MTDLCVEFGISRKTGYKIYDRYKQSGSEALTDRSKRPWRYANQLPPQLEAQIVGLKHDKPHWGARKIRELLVRRLASGIKVPARSTIHAVLDRNGLVKRMGRRRNKAHGTTLSAGANPNDLWCADFKGEFTLGNKRYCYPLTVTDHASRYLLMCEALKSTREDTAFEAFEQLFREGATPAGNPLRQWRALCLAQCPVQSVKARRLVAQAWHLNRTDQTRPSPAERTPRAYAQNLEAGDNQATQA